MNSGVRGPLRRRPLSQFKLKSRSYSHLPGQTRKEGRKASPRERPRERSRLPIGKEAPPTSGKKVAPKEGEPTTKQEGGKEWHWCSKHKAWTKHKESECKRIDFKPSYDRAKKESQPKNSNSPKMKLANALAAISDTEDDE